MLRVDFEASKAREPLRAVRTFFPCASTCFQCSKPTSNSNQQRRFLGAQPDQILAAACRVFYLLFIYYLFIRGSLIKPLPRQTLCGRTAPAAQPIQSCSRLFRFRPRRARRRNRLRKRLQLSSVNIQSGVPPLSTVLLYAFSITCGPPRFENTKGKIPELNN